MTDEPIAKPLGIVIDDKGLTKEERVEVQNRLAEKLGSPECEMCHATSWSVSETVVSLPPLITSEGPGAIRLDVGFLYPLLPVVCTNCGNTKLFQMRMLQVLSHLFAPDSGDDDDDEEVGVS